MTERNKTTQPNETTSIDDILSSISMAPDSEPNRNQPNPPRLKLSGGEDYYGPFTRSRRRSNDTLSTGIIQPSRFRPNIRQEPYSNTLQSIINHESPSQRISQRPIRVLTPVGRHFATGDIQIDATTEEPLDGTGITSQSESRDTNVSSNTSAPTNIPTTAAYPESNAVQDMDIDSPESGSTQYKDLLLIAEGLKLIELPTYLSKPLLILAKKLATAMCKHNNSMIDMHSAAFGIKTAELTFKNPPKFALDCANAHIILLRANYISNLRDEAQVNINKLQQEVTRLQSLETIKEIIGSIVIHNNNHETWTWELLRCYVDQQGSILINQFTQKRNRDKETKAKSDARLTAKRAEQGLSKSPESRTLHLEKAVLTLQRKLKNMKISPTPSKKEQSSKKVNERKLKDSKTKNSKPLSKGKGSKNTPKKSTGEKKKGKTTGQNQTAKITIVKRKKNESR